MSIEQEEMVREHNLHAETLINEAALKKSQNEMILEYLKRGNSLTPMSALAIFKCWALSSRISNLRQAGNDIRSKFIAGENKKHYKEYWL